MTKNEESLELVNEWYRRVKLASLELPDGWFGRPYDNLHQMTWSVAREHKVLLELDNQLLLVLTDPDHVRVEDLELHIDGCAQVTLDWQEYGNLKHHIEDHGRGTVRFVAQGAAPRR